MGFQLLHHCNHNVLLHFSRSSLFWRCSCFSIKWYYSSLFRYFFMICWLFSQNVANFQRNCLKLPRSVWKKSRRKKSYHAIPSPPGPKYRSGTAGTSQHHIETPQAAPEGPENTWAERESIMWDEVRNESDLNGKITLPDLALHLFCAISWRSMF